MICPYYLPGHKAGGALRTLVNMVEVLGEELDFFVVTLDRDHTERQPYPDVTYDRWNQVGKAQVRYLRGGFSPGILRRLVEDVSPEVTYLNSAFARSAVRVLALRRSRLWPLGPVVVAPEGEFSPSALAFKRKKKAAFLRAAAGVGLYDGVVWKASSAEEKANVERLIGPEATVHVAPNVPTLALLAEGEAASSAVKKCGAARLLYLSRVSPVKNLDFLLRVLVRVNGSIDLDVVGAVDDDAYWASCQESWARLPCSVRAEYRGAVASAEVPKLMRESHFFVLPTLGENFGHVVFEALASGCPPLVSDKTPWRDLTRQKAGWDVPLDEDAWAQTLQGCVDMGEGEYREMSDAARRLAVAWPGDSGLIDANRALFRYSGESGRAR